MEIVRERDKGATSRAAAARASSKLREAIGRRGAARFCVATGSSQFDFLQALTSDGSIDWSRTAMFHLDEYTGISENHPASFRRYLRERLVDRVQPGEVHFIRGEAPDPQAECHRISDLIRQGPIDVAFIGIGGKTATWPSTTRRPISIPGSPTSWSPWTPPAGGSRSPRAGSPASTRYRHTRSPCPSVRS